MHAVLQQQCNVLVPQQQHQHPFQQQQQHQRHRQPALLLKCRRKDLRISKHEQHQHKSPPHKRIKVIAYASALPFAALAAAQASNAAATVPASSTAALVAAATGPHLPAILSSAGVLILCCAAAALLLTGIPLLWSLTRATNRMESMMQTLEMELPDTAASIRLSSLELSDCMSELGALGNDISSGVRATAQLVTSAEAGVRQGATLVGAAVVPALARRETRVRDVLEAALKARAALAPQIPKARAAVAATTATARKLRGAVMLTKLAAGVFDIGRAVRMQLIVAAADQVLQRETQQRQQQQSGRSQLKGRQKKQPKPDQQQ